MSAASAGGLTIQVDGRTLPAAAGDNLLQVCLSHGLDLPYFCWHPALGAVGACRQCAVKQFHDPHDQRGRLVMACMTAASEGMRISIADAEAAEFRASVIEWLMTNHPHDCPVCEEGGECHLQDMTHLTGHVYRRYRFNKRTHRNQYLGPFVKHEMNRCIACYRCVRFYRDYAGGRDLDVFGAHNHVYFGRQSDGVLESEFSGNLVEVCPTGVFTDKTFSEHYTRKWDLESTPSVCEHCGLGCNVFPNARYGQLRRIINRYHHHINGYFLCDRGRYGYGFVNGAARLRQPVLAQRSGEHTAHPLSPALALTQLTRFLQQGESAASGQVLGIGSPRASLESNFALRSLVGPDHFHLGIAEEEARLLGTVLRLLQQAPAPIATLRDAEECDAVLVLGEDVAETAPRLALGLRQMVRQASLARARKLKVPEWQDTAVRDLGHDVRSPLIVASADATRLDDVATATLRLAPADIARLGRAIAHALDADGTSMAELPEDVDACVGDIAAALRSAARPLIVAGTGAGSEAVLEAAAAVAAALRGAGRDARLLLTVPECNSLGAALMGGQPLASVLQAAADGRVATLLVLENDLYRRAERALVDAALERCRQVVVIDHSEHGTSERADLILPAATFAESSGTLVNNEARAQRFFQLLFPDDGITASWRWLNDAACASGRTTRHWEGLDEALADLGRELPRLAAAAAAAPPADYRIADSRIASAPHRESGRTAITANRTLHEPPPPANPDSPYTQSMEGFYGAMPAALYPFFWAPDWNSEQALNKFQQEVGGPLRGGSAGVRLLDASPAPAAAPRPASTHAEAIPEAFTPRAGEWLLLACYRVFGSEEMSARSAAIGERMTAARLGLHPLDASELGIGEGDAVQIDLPAALPPIAAELRPALPRGVATLTIGLPGQPYIGLPAWARLSRARP